MKDVRLISIDFDFFQKVDKDTIGSYYPDGVDLSTDLSKMVWTGYYVHPNTKKKLEAVTCDEDALNTMKSILSHCPTIKDVLMTNSHVHIYEFIHELMEKYKTSSLHITHIDMHHDVLNKNTEVDCGNWLGRISEEYHTKVEWIPNPISLDVYGLTKMIKHILGKGLPNLKEADSQGAFDGADALFLCRSDAWTPPHLDKYFDDLYHHIINTFGNSGCKIMGEKCISEPRDMSKEIDVYNDAMKQAEIFLKEKKKHNEEKLS